MKLCNTGRHSILGILCFTAPASAFAPIITSNGRISVLRNHPSFHRGTHVPSSSRSAASKRPDADADASDENRFQENVWRSFQSVVATAFTASVLFCNVVPPLGGGSHSVFVTPRPPVAWAEQVSDTSTSITAKTTIGDTSSVITDSITSSKTGTAEATAAVTKEYSVIDEVWALADKYYIDRTFNDQDWYKVREEYNDRSGKNPSDEKIMKLVTEMTKSLGDKYSRVLDKGAYAAIQKFDLIGVGVTLMPNSEKEIIVGAPPIAESASDKGGLKSGDYIMAVNGVKTKGRTAFDIIDQISEIPDAKTVTMTVRTQGTNDLVGEGYVRDVTMNRVSQEIKDPVVSKISETRSDGTKVGYVRIFEFNSKVKASLEQALRRLEREGANAFVIDLRSNPGGAFQSAVEISSLFVEDRVATYVVDSNQVELPFKTTKGQVVVGQEQPIAIWVDAGSASASEVFAGSMHDNCRAIIMGKRSFGKGLIQAVYGLKNGAGLVLTVANYVTPNGSVIQGKGVTPDIEGKVGIDVPGLSSDTSQVDFKEIARRLEPAMCKLPEN